MLLTKSMLVSLHYQITNAARQNKNIMKKAIKDLKNGDRFMAGAFPATITGQANGGQTVQYKLDAAKSARYNVTWVGKNSAPSRHKPWKVEIIEAV